VALTRAERSFDVCGRTRTATRTLVASSPWAAMATRPVHKVPCTRPARTKLDRDPDKRTCGRFPPPVANHRVSPVGFPPQNMWGLLSKYVGATFGAAFALPSSHFKDFEIVRHIVILRCKCTRKWSYSIERLGQ
jgi:hypothetical protein